MNAPIEGIFVTVSVLLLTGMVTCRPRRRFCENFPFAPRCLGVAAKRDVSHSYHIDTDINDEYKDIQSLINQYGKDDATEIWDVSNDDISNKYVVPYQLISHLLQRRRRHNVLRDTEVIQPDIWVDYE